MCVNPIIRMNSSFECSDNESSDLVTLNMVLMMSWDEYPRLLEYQVSGAGRRSQKLTIALSVSPKLHRSSVPDNF